MVSGSVIEPIKKKKPNTQTYRSLEELFMHGEIYQIYQTRHTLINAKVNILKGTHKKDPCLCVWVNETVRKKIFQIIYQQ